MPGKAEIPAGSAEKVFIESIKRVKQLGTENKINAAVDLGVTFSSVMIDEKGGLLALFKGKSTNHQSIELKLATRIYLEAPPDPTN